VTAAARRAGPRRAGLVVDFGAVRAVGGFDLSVGGRLQRRAGGPQRRRQVDDHAGARGVLPPSAGRVLVAGRDASRDPAGVRAAVGYCPTSAG
jgi:ABC-2 type transport system ATP-binding protein